MITDATIAPVEMTAYGFPAEPPATMAPGAFRHPFSLQARRQAVAAELRLSHDWSDRRLQEKLGISRDTISRVRRALIADGSIPAAEARSGRDGKLYTRAGRHRPPRVKAAPVPVDGGAVMDEMIGLMVKQTLEVVAWTQAEGFEASYKTAGANARGLFQTVVIKLAARADQLRRL